MSKESSTNNKKPNTGPRSQGKPAAKSYSGKPGAKSSKPAGRSGKPDSRSSKPDSRGSKPDGRSGKPDSRGGKPDNRGGKPYRPASRPADAERRPTSSERAAFEKQIAETEALIISGRNAVLEALKSGQNINRVWLAETSEAYFTAQVHELCKKRGIPCANATKSTLTRLAGEDNRGVVAELAAVDYVELDDLLALAVERGEDPLIVLLDGVEDPHNLGAIIRTALAAGAHGVVLPKRRSAAVTATVLKTSAGAACYLPIARVANLHQALLRLQEAGLHAVAADMHGDKLWDCDLNGPLAIVLGSEGAGVSTLLKKTADSVVAIPMRGEIGSLNVSAAAAVILYEAARRRG